MQHVPQDNACAWEASVTFVVVAHNDQYRTVWFFCMNIYITLQLKIKQDHILFVIVGGKWGGGGGGELTCT